MKKLLFVFLVFLPVLVYGQVVCHTVHMPDTIPQSLSDIVELKAVVSGGWELDKNIGGILYTLSPSYIGYREGAEEKWPSVQDALICAYNWFYCARLLTLRTEEWGAFYQDEAVKVFIKIELFITSKRRVYW